MFYKEGKEEGRKNIHIYIYIHIQRKRVDRKYEIKFSLQTKFTEINLWKIVGNEDNIDSDE